MEASIKGLGIDKLSVADRFNLMEEIWDSIAIELDGLEIPDWHREELDRRAAATDPRIGEPWSAVKARLQG